MEDEKKWWASKTLWANAIALAASVASVVGLEIGPEEQGAVVGGVMALVNIGLRLMTTQALMK